MTILLCYDGSPDSQRSIETAGRLLPQRDAVVLHVSKSFVDWTLGPSLGPLLEIPGVAEAIVAEAEKVLAEGIAFARAAGFDARGELRTTGRSAWRTVLEFAHEHHIDLIVAGSHGQRLRDHLGLGSVSQGLVSHSSVPVLITHANDEVNQRANGDHIRAVVAFDGSAASEHAARELVRLLPNVDVNVVAAWDTPGQLGTALMTDPLASQAESLSEQLSVEAQRVAQRGAAIVEQLGATATATSVASESGIGASINTAARDSNADVIALGTQGHHFITRALLGSTAKYVVQHADLPVLVVPAHNESQSG